jgi:hypothetical protein
MKTLSSKSTVQPDATANKVDRRGVVIGAGVAGAAALAGHTLLRGGLEASPPTGAAAAAAAGKAEGYRLTPHVLRYYETTKA